jgi:hypothetical protein
VVGGAQGPQQATRDAVTEPSQRNGFSIRSWSDVLAVIAIITMLASAVAWGLKLDQRTTDHEARLSKIEGR